MQHASRNNQHASTITSFEHHASRGMPLALHTSPVAPLPLHISRKRTRRLAQHTSYTARDVSIHRNDMRPPNACPQTQFLVRTCYRCGSSTTTMQFLVCTCYRCGSSTTTIDMSSMWSPKVPSAWPCRIKAVQRKTEVGQRAVQGATFQGLEGIGSGHTQRMGLDSPNTASQAEAAGLVVPIALPCCKLSCIMATT